MWGDLIFPISHFIMLKFADNLTIIFFKISVHLLKNIRTF